MHQRPPHPWFVRHPIRAAVREAGHLHDVAEAGESPATPAIVAAGVLLLVVPLAALLILLDVASGHFS